MASPKHKCANEDCQKMVSARATHCRNHFPRTPEHIENQAKAMRGRKVSAETRRKLSEAMSNRINVKCKWCGKEFGAIPSSLKKGYSKYCSSKCAYAARAGANSRFWNGGKTRYECALCGKIIEKRSCHAKGKNVFCSYSCNSIYKKAHQVNQNTDIERIMRQALQDKEIAFEEQIPLCNVTIADFYIKSKGVAIFCDGEYWHRLDGRQERDKRQRATLRENGITPIAFWGNEIKTNAAACIKEIERTLCQ